MLYNIRINQKVIVDCGFSLDFDDAAIVDLLVTGSNSDFITKMSDNGTTYYQFRWKWIASQLPLLRSKSRSGITLRLKKLSELNIIKPWSQNASTGNSFYAFSGNYQRLFFGYSKSEHPIPNSEHPYSKSDTRPIPNSEHYNSIDYNNINNNKEEGKPSLPPKKPSKKFNPPSIEEVKAYCQERNNSIDPEVFVDFYASKGWMIGKGKMKDWKAAVRTWEKRESKTQQQTLFKNPSAPVSDYSKSNPDDNTF